MKKNLLIIIVSLLCMNLSIFSVNASGGDLIWSASQSILGSEESRLMTSHIDDSGIYYGGFTWSLVSRLGHWLIEKRDLSGNIVWSKTSHQTTSYVAGPPVVKSIVSNSSNIYALGSTGSPSTGPGYMELEKRDKVSGLLISTTKICPSSEIPSYECSADGNMAIDSTGVYIFGLKDPIRTVPFTKEPKWSIQKLDLSGNLSWRVELDHSIDSNSGYYSNVETASDISVYNGSIYAIGNFSLNGKFTGILEKRSASNGSLIWSINTNKINSSDWSLKVEVDSTGVYVTGLSYERISPTYSPINYYSKFDLENGNLLWRKEYSVDPVVINSSLLNTALGSSGIYFMTGAVDRSFAKYNKLGLFSGELIANKKVDYPISNYTYYGGPIEIYSDNIYNFSDTLSKSTVIDKYSGNNLLHESYLIEKRSDLYYSNGAQSFIDIGLKVNQGTNILPDIQSIAIEDPLTATSSTLMISKNNNIYRVALVDISDPNASKIHLKNKDGTIVALRKYTSTIDPSLFDVILTTSTFMTTSGSSVTLTWKPQNTASCTAESSPSIAGWSGSKSNLGGTQSIIISSKTTFGITCSNSSGEFVKAFTEVGIK